MSPDQLSTLAWRSAPGPAARAVLSVLAGQPLDTVAREAGMEPIALADAVEVYQHAGNEALACHELSTAWRQVYLQFPDWRCAEQTVAAHLAPVLHHLARHEESISQWWYIRKHPCWRLRLLGHPESQAHAELGSRLDDLAATGHLSRWWPGIYEPETAAFGGTVGMLSAHTLFSADSHHILALPGRTDMPVGRREISALLCTVMMRAAGLECQEQGDVWDRVITEEHRSATQNIPHKRLTELTRQIRQILSSDTSSQGPVFGEEGVLHAIFDWAEAFRRAGNALREANISGSLHRGIRRILAYHIIFHWNRLGLSIEAQSALALAARTAILEPPEPDDTT
ncbi:thiopeptide-type bacteriocin biosynthesis protein [Streptomyces sp. MAR4 CNY-716]